MRYRKEDETNKDYFQESNEPDCSESDENNELDDKIPLERKLEPDFVGRPQRWYLGSTFRAFPDQKNYRRLWNLQKETLYDCQGKR
ncbi:MAG: hypothetical protein ACFE9R_20190, partial [Candidatus Hermodarchaeota archaeon]